MLEGRNLDFWKSTICLHWLFYEESLKNHLESSSFSKSQLLFHLCTAFCKFNLHIGFFGTLIKGSVETFLYPLHKIWHTSLQRQFAIPDLIWVVNLHFLEILSGVKYFLKTLYLKFQPPHNLKRWSLDELNLEIR